MTFNLGTIKTIALALAILVVFNLFIGMGLSTFYPSPSFDDFCPKDTQTPQTEEACVEAGGKWIQPGQTTVHGEVAPRPVMLEGERTYCDATFTCRQAYDDAPEEHQRNAFIVWVIAGVVALVIGQTINASAAVSSGLTFGGVLAFIIGATGYWSNMDEILRFILLGIVLAVLIWLGYRKTR